MSIRVRATKRGYMGHLIEPGEEFEIESVKEMGSWMERIRSPKPVKEKEEKEEKEAMKQKIN